MKKRYLYLVFTSLSILVVILIAVIFKLSKTTDAQEEISIFKTQESEKLQTLVEAQNYEDSWIGKISKEKNQKTYQYSEKKFYIEFN